MSYRIKTLKILISYEVISKTYYLCLNGITAT
jgi:hypothetical protein